MGGGLGKLSGMVMGQNESLAPLPRSQGFSLKGDVVIPGRQELLLEG